MKDYLTPVGVCSSCMRPFSKKELEQKKLMHSNNIKKALKHRKENGFPIGRPRIRDDVAIAKLRNEGLSIREISKQLSICRASVHKSIKESGLD